MSAETISKPILSQAQIQQKVNRLAFEIYENNFEEQTICLAGIEPKGFWLASLLAKQLQQISPLKVELLSVQVDKDAPLQSEIQLSLPAAQLQNQVVVLVDDVLNTGRTLAYALKPFLNTEIKKLQTAILVDRGYPQFPVLATYVGYELATTLQERVEVQFENEQPVSVVLR